MKMDVSIIIVNYNTKRLTSDCISSIVEKTQGISYEIILVDNASTDGSKELFEKDARVTYLYSEKNGGFGYGNNMGMKVARGKYFFLLNSDTLLVNNAIKEFFDYAENQKQKRVYGCYLQNAEGQYVSYSFYFPAFSIKEFVKRFFCKNHDETVDLQVKTVEAVSGADMFFDSEIYTKTNGFDENIFLYGEEGEWQYRILQAGYSCCIIPQPQIIHFEGQSMKMSPAKTAIKWKSHFYILKKHMRYTTYLLARIFYASNLTLRYFPHICDMRYKSFFKTLFSPIKLNQ